MDILFFRKEIRSFAIGNYLT